MVPKLERIDEFDVLLAGYTPHPETVDMARSVKMVQLLGTFAAGRNTIINELVKKGNYLDLITDTTRPPRVNDGVLEQNGVEYYFKSETEFLDRLQEGRYLEAAILHRQQASGISEEELTRAKLSGKIALFDADIAGALKLKSLLPEVTIIFVTPPSFDEWVRRFMARGMNDQAEIRRRMESAEKEIETAIEQSSFHFVINDSFMQAVAEIDAICQNQPEDTTRRQAAKDTAWKLLNEIKRELYS